MLNLRSNILKKKEDSSLGFKKYTEERINNFEKTKSFLENLGYKIPDLHNLKEVYPAIPELISLKNRIEEKIIKKEISWYEFDQIFSFMLHCLMGKDSNIINLSDTYTKVQLMLETIPLDSLTKISLSNFANQKLPILIKDLDNLTKIVSEYKKYII